MNFVFDTVENAKGFAQAVLAEGDSMNIFRPAKSFVSPRGPDDLTKDFSEKCIIL